MKYIKYLLALIIWSTTAFGFTGKSFMTYRSQGFNLARSVSGWEKSETEHNASVAVEYTRSFDPSAINKYFFGCNECNQLIFSGSRFENRGKNDILADYFGLPTDFKSVVNFSPRVQNVITDFDFYWNLSGRPTGFNLRIDVPLAYSKWTLDPCETVISSGTLAYPAGYMSNARIEHDQLKKGALDVLSGCQTFGDLTYPLQYGRIVDSQHATKFADVLVALGYTFISQPHGRFGADVHVVIPTGTRSHARNLFEPQIGNGHHWALGVSLTGCYNFIGDEDSDWSVSASIDAYIQHLFKTTQLRSYDLKKSGCGSRYVLLEDMISRVSITQGFSPVPLESLLDNQYITRLLYAIDATTLASTIKIDVQADIVAKFTAHYHNWNFDLGYNFWARSKEKLVSRECLNHKFYGVKGDAQIYGYLILGPGFEIPLPLNATQSHATLHAGQGNGNTTDNFVNNNADNAALTYNVGAPVAQTTPASLSGTGATSLEQVNGSNQAIILSDNDINNCSGLSPRALSNKVFGSVGRTVDYWPRVTCFFSLGAEGEFGMKTDGVKTAISQWGVWAKGSVNY
jgi:hypothetical protein